MTHSAPLPSRARAPETHAARSAPTFEALLKPLLPTAYRAALHLTRNQADAEDVVQEAVLLALKGFGGFQLGTNFKASLEALPEEYRAVATLYFVDDLSYQDIATMLDCPVGTVRSRLHRARKLLQPTLWDLAVDSGIVGAA